LPPDLLTETLLILVTVDEFGSSENWRWCRGEPFEIADSGRGNAADSDSYSKESDDMGVVAGTADEYVSAGRDGAVIAAAFGLPDSMELDNWSVVCCGGIFTS
jgi:hypothetical protein